MENHSIPISLSSCCVCIALLTFLYYLTNAVIFFTSFFNINAYTFIIFNIKVLWYSVKLQTGECPWMATIYIRMQNIFSYTVLDIVLNCWTSFSLHMSLWYMIDVVFSWICNIMKRQILTVTINDSANINKTNNYLSPQSFQTASLV